METVEPIRKRKQIDALKIYLKGKNMRDYLLFILGINSGLRISDLLRLQVTDVKNRNRIYLREKKTGKAKDFPLSESCKRVIKDYLLQTGLIDGPLFPSRKKGKPLGRIQAYRILSDAALSIGITDSVGTHTLRKTFGYHCFQQGIDITRIQQLLNHSSPAQTLRYIGITREELDAVYINIDL